MLFEDGGGWLQRSRQFVSDGGGDGTHPPQVV